MSFQSIEFLPSSSTLFFQRNLKINHLQLQLINSKIIPTDTHTHVCTYRLGTFLLEKIVGT